MRSGVVCNGENLGRNIHEEIYSTSSYCCVNIINNLSFGNIESDKDMTELYAAMLSIISRKRASDEDGKRLKSYYSTAEQRRLTYALSNIVQTEAEIRASEAQAEKSERMLSDFSAKKRSIVSVWLGNLAVSCVSFFSGNVFAVGEMAAESVETYHNYRTNKAKRESAESQLLSAKNNLDQKRVRLSRLQEEMQQDKAMLNEELKASLWRLERQDIDEFRLTQNSLKNFYQAVQEEETSRRSRMLRDLESEFRSYLRTGNTGRRLLRRPGILMRLGNILRSSGKFGGRYSGSIPTCWRQQSSGFRT